jgi:IMP cyclohydrolase
MSDLRDRADAAFARHLAGNPYPGRGLVLGRSEDGTDWLQLYWIMGRSPNSRNRVFVADGATLRTEPFDAAAVEDPSLILYEAMLEGAGVYVVSNGDQTRTIADTLAGGGSFEAALATREREPDAPNYTPRISGLIDLRGRGPAFALSILKANPADPERTDRISFRPAPPPPGFGLGLTTYRGDGSPLPSFEGEPLWLPLGGAPEAVLERYWQALDRANRVALALKRIPFGGGPGRLLVRNAHPA